MRLYWPEPGGNPEKPKLVANRKALVEHFNKIMGVRHAEDFFFQAAFIAGKVPYNEAVSFVRFASFMIATTDSKSE